jgi:uncharacterized protein YbjQ (UPF0145 family)
MGSVLDDVIVVTTNDVAGHEIVAVQGEVFGLIVCARNVFSNLGASLRTLVGDDVGTYTQLLTDSRLHAVERLRAAAVEKGGNVVVAMRFDGNEIAGIMSEIAAYGTAVTIRPKLPQAREITRRGRRDPRCACGSEAASAPADDLPSSTPRAL